MKDWKLGGLTWPPGCLVWKPGGPGLGNFPAAHPHWLHSKPREEEPPPFLYQKAAGYIGPEYPSFGGLTETGKPETS